MPRDPPRMIENLGRERIFVPGDIARLLQQRQIAIGFDIAHRARIAVPVPGAAEIAAGLDHAQALEADLPQARAGQETAEPAADDRAFDLVKHRRTGEAGLHIGIVDIAGEVGLHLDIVAHARFETLVPLEKIFFVESLGIEIDIPDHTGNFRQDLHLRAHIR